MDGAVVWRKFEEMAYVHSANLAHVPLIAQDDLGGWVPPPEARATFWKK